MHRSKIHILKYVGEHDTLWTPAYGVISLSCSAEAQNSKVFEEREKETKKKERKRGKPRKKKEECN